MNTNSIRQMTVGTRWLARVASLCSIAAILMFLTDFDPAKVSPREWVGLIFFPFGVITGMVVAWWREGWGACMAIVSLIAFYAVYGWILGSNVNSAAFIVFASPAFLFLVTWLLAKSNSREVTVHS